MSKHTPGPWNAIQHNEKDSRVAAKTLLAIVYSEAFRDRENQIANARLIAAAPELLEACRQVSIALTARGLETSVCGVVDRAIAKAEGTADAQREPLQNTPEATQRGEKLGNGSGK